MQFFKTLAIAALSLSSSVFAAPGLDQRGNSGDQYSCGDMQTQVTTLKTNVYASFSEMDTISSQVNSGGDSQDHFNSMNTCLKTLSGHFSSCSDYMTKATYAISVQMAESDLLIVISFMSELQELMSTMQTKFESSYSCFNDHHKQKLSNTFNTCLKSAGQVITPTTSWGNKCQYSEKAKAGVKYNLQGGAQQSVANSYGGFFGSAKSGNYGSVSGGSTKGAQAQGSCQQKSQSCITTYTNTCSSSGFGGKTDFKGFCQSDSSIKGQGAFGAWAGAQGW